MKKLPISSVKRWTTKNNLHVPRSISTICPTCDAIVTFTMVEDLFDPHSRVFVSSGICPSCDAKSTFLTLQPKPSKNQEDRDPSAVCINPAPTAWHQTVELTENIPEPLQRAFCSTVDAYNSKNYVATAVCCRRTLEGIFKYLVGEDKRDQSLVKLIEEVRKNEDLSKPLGTLSHAIRAGGNLGAHFDQELEPDHAMAKHMVELLEYMISYLYILPERIEGLDSLLTNQAEIG